MVNFSDPGNGLNSLNSVLGVHVAKQFEFGIHLWLALYDVRVFAFMPKFTLFKSA